MKIAKLLHISFCLHSFVHINTNNSITYYVNLDFQKHTQQHNKQQHFTKSHIFWRCCGVNEPPHNKKACCRRVSRERWWCWHTRRYSASPPWEEFSTTGVPLIHTIPARSLLCWRNRNLFTLTKSRNPSSNGKTFFGWINTKLFVLLLLLLLFVQIQVNYKFTVSYIIFELSQVLNFKLPK